MKTRVANILVVGLVLAGTLLLGNLASIGQEGEVISTLFLCFFAVIVAIQVVPAMMLFGYLCKALFRKASRKKATVAAPGGNES